MKKILHLSYDLRDRYDRKVTPAVKNLIKATEAISVPFVVDLVRVPTLKEERIDEYEDDHLKINVVGLPLAIFINQTQKRAFNHILKRLTHDDVKQIDIIHTHKLVFEGQIAYRFHKKFGTPFIVTIRQSDMIVLKYKPWLIRSIKPILASAEKIIFLIPSMKPVLKSNFGNDFYNQRIKDKLVFIPNIVERESVITEGNINKDEFLSVLALNKKSIIRKNLNRLLKAMALTKSNIKLNIAGDGTEIHKVEKRIKNLNLHDRVKLIGKIKNNEIDSYYASHAGFLLPSRSESFGLVYVEALMNGTPIMYSTNCLGFDGLYEGVGVGVDPYSVESISEGIMTLHEKQEEFSENIRMLSKKGAFKIFSSDAVRKSYETMLSSLG